MAQPATAAAVIAAIFSTLLVAYLSYKLYVRIQYRRLQRKQELPPIREPVSTYGHTLVSSGNSQAGTLYGTTEWPDGWKGSASRASLGTSSHLNGFNSESRRPSVVGYLQSPQAVAADLSAPSSPLSPGVDADLPTPPGETYDHLRGISSSSSTMALKRSYAASSLRGSTGTQSPIMSTRPRDSYLPHLPSNRESIHIVTPQPLGFGVGGMAQAMDQRTLAFSKASGIGSTDDDFTSGLVWAGEGGNNGSGGVNEFGAASSSRFGEEERMRYLAEGPNRTFSSASGRGPTSSPAASDVIMPGDSVSRSRSPASKSRTPSPANKARATGTEGTTAGHPLAVSDTDARLGHHAVPSFIAQQSPLQIMSQRMDVGGAPAPLPKDRHFASSTNGRPREHHRVLSDADTLATAASYGENGGRGSPILSGGFAAAAQNTPDRYPSDLPSLDSPGQGGSGADTNSTPTGPSTATDGSSGRPSASVSASDREAEMTSSVSKEKDGTEKSTSPFGGRSFALGADGQLRMVGREKDDDAQDLEAATGRGVKGAKGGRKSSSWLPSIMGGSA